MATPEIPGRQLDASVFQTIGSLDAKATQAQTDVTALRQDVRAIDASLARLPAQVEEIVARVLGPTEGRLGKVEATLSDVQQTVVRWKTVLALLTSVAVVAGFLLSQIISLKKLFGVG